MSRRFAFAPVLPLLELVFTVVAMGSPLRWVEVDEQVLRVRFGIGFRADIPRRAITGASVGTGRVWSWGVHGFAGDWLVNTTGSGLVVVDIAPPARAWVLCFPIRLRRLRISLADPYGFLAALGVR